MSFFNKQRIFMHITGSDKADKYTIINVDKIQKATFNPSENKVKIYTEGGDVLITTGPDSERMWADIEKILMKRTQP